MVRRLERTQHIGDIEPGRVWRAQEENVGDADRGQRLSCLDLAYLAQSAGLFESNEVLACVAAGGNDHGHMPVLVENSLREVSGDRRLVIRVRRDNEDIGFEPFVRRRICGRLLRFCNVGERCEQHRTD